MFALAKLCPPGDLKQLLVDAKGISQSLDLVLGASRGLCKGLNDHAVASAKAASVVPK